jgi:hypothetical protein
LEPDAVPPVLVGGDIADTRKDLLDSWGAAVIASADVRDILDAIAGLLPARNAA